MKYSFYKNEIDTTKDIVFLVKPDTDILKNFGGINYQEGELQDLINRIVSSKDANKGSEKEYEYQLEDDLYIVSNEEGVFFLI